MTVGEKTYTSFHRRKHRTHENVEPDEDDRGLLVNVLKSGSRYAGPQNLEDYRMFDTYIRYLCDRLKGGCADPNVTLHDLVSMFAIVVEYFTATARVNSTVEQFLNEKRAEIVAVFPKADTDQEDWRRSRLMDTVNSIALWLTIEDFGTKFHNGRVQQDFYDENVKLRNELAKNKEELEHLGKFTIRTFADVAGLVPKIAPWVNGPQANPFEEIPKSSLNARLILRIGQIKLNWTFDISRHLKFEHSTLDLFCMPSRLIFEPDMQEAESPDKALTQMGFTRSYVEEVKRSYLLLFGPQFKALFEDEFASETFPEPKDPYLRTACLRSPDHANLDKLESWLKSDFPYLWPRIKELEQHVRNIRPDSLWKLLYRDRRDSLAWYTFVFAVVVLILTFLSTAFTGIQTLKAFYPTAPAAPSGATSSITSPTGVTSRTASLTPTTTVLTKSSAGSQTVMTSTRSLMNISTATPSPSTNSSALSGGAIAGIVIGTLAAVAAIVGILLNFVYMRRRKLSKTPAYAQTYDAENTVKPSYAFPPSSDILSSPRRQFTEFSGSTDSGTEDIRTQYVMSPIGPESAGQPQRILTISSAA